MNLWYRPLRGLLFGTLYGVVKGCFYHAALCGSFLQGGCPVAPGPLYFIEIFRQRPGRRTKADALGFCVLNPLFLPFPTALSISVRLAAPPRAQAFSIRCQLLAQSTDILVYTGISFLIVEDRPHQGHGIDTGFPAAPPPFGKLLYGGHPDPLLSRFDTQLSKSIPFGN